MSATQSEPIPLRRLSQVPYVQVLTYPRVTLREAKRRLSQLEKLGVSAIIFDGPAKIGRLGILGLGTVGIVVKAEAGGSLLALKVRRTDANRPSMENEFQNTLLANRIGVGAPVYAATKDFMTMKLLDYVDLSDWFRGLRGKGSRASARAMVHSVLNQCRKLDIVGLDHGQLSNLRKHVVVAEGVAWVIDFESASRTRKPHNVTAAAQHMLVGGKESPLVRRLIGMGRTEPLLRRLREYKTDLSDITYARLLESLKLVQR